MYDRTHYEAVLDVRYGRRLNYLHAKLYKNINTLFSFVNLLCGTAAFGAYTTNNTNIILDIGLVMAASSILSIIANPAIKAAEFSEKSRYYAKLNADAPALSLTELEQQLATLQGDTTPLIEAFRTIAYNDNLRENGREDALIPASLWQSFLNLIN